MAAYFYRALNSQGKLSKGVIEGDSERQVRNQLRAKQLKPVAVSLSGKQTQNPQRKQSIPKVRVSHADLTLLTRQLATLVQSNMPLDEALSAVAQQTRKASLKSLVLQVRSRVLEGHSLAYALGDFPGVFNTLYCAMVKAGEHAGFLGQVLEQLADYTENSQYTRQQLKMAMIYPLVLMLVAVAMVALLMTFVVPELVSLFAHNAAELPWITQALIASSDFIRGWGWLVAMLVIVALLGFKHCLKAPAKRRLWHRALLKLPLLGGFLVAADSARFAATLSILVSSGVPLLEGLKIAAQVLNNWVLRDASLQVASSVQEGMSLHKALTKADVFPPIMVHMVASGEASGEVETMLARAAKNQERELEMALGTVMSIFEPAMILIMAVLVGAIVVAILLPIIEMNNLVA